MLLALTLLAVPTLATASAHAPVRQDGLPVESEAPQATTETAAPEISVPETVAEAIEHDPDDLREQLGGLDAAELGLYLAAWTRLLEEQQAEVVKARASSRHLSGGPRTVGLVVDRDELIADAEVIGSLLEARGGNAESTWKSIAAIRQASLDRAEVASTVPPSMSAALELQVEVLKANLRPLTAEQVAQELAAWMVLLRTKCLSVRSAEVAALRSDSGEEIERFNSRAVVLRTERERLIALVTGAIEELEAKGGDVAEARAYVDSVVETPPITGWRAALTTGQAWLVNPDGGVELGLQVAKAVGVLVAAWFLSLLLGRVARRAMRSLRKVSDLLREFVTASVKRVTILLGALIALSQLGVNMGPMLAAIGAAGLVVGLALQGTLSNFASGLLIMTSRPFDVGDLISTAGIEGLVRGMTLVNTRIETLDKRTIFIPNNMVWGDVITNISAGGTRRVDLTFGIGYGDDLREAQRILREVVTAHEKVLGDPEPTIRVHELGDSSVNFAVRPWVRNPDYWDVYWDLTESVKEAFDREGISIPFPQRDVHMIPVPAQAGTGDELQPAPRPVDGHRPTEQEQR